MGSSCSVGSTNTVADPSNTDPSSCPMPRPKEDGPPPQYETAEPQPHTTTHNNNNTDTQPAACSKATGVKSVAPPLAAKYHFPGYEPAPVVCDKVIAVCEKSWTLLMTGETKPLQLMKANDRNSSPSIAFYDTFYQYLADKHPDTMLFFKNTNIQSRATSLAKMLSSGFNLAHQHGDKMHEMLTNISSSHAKLLKVNADHYTPVVMALMHTLETLFGEDAYTAEISSAWYHLYSLILNVMIPAAEEAYKHLPASESSSAALDSSFPVPLSPPLSTAPAPLSPPALARPLDEVKDEVKEKKQEEEPAASTSTTTTTTEERPETHTTSEETKVEAKEEKKEEVESTQQEEVADSNSDSSNENKQVAEAPEQEAEKAEESEKEAEKEAEEAGKEEEKESQEDPVAKESEQNLTHEAEHPAAVTAEETEEVQQDAQQDDAAPAASESASEGEASESA